jgi:hypothetical protein
MPPMEMLGACPPGRRVRGLLTSEAGRWSDLVWPRAYSTDHHFRHDLPGDHPLPNTGVKAGRFCAAPAVQLSALGGRGRAPQCEADRRP